MTFRYPLHTQSNLNMKENGQEVWCQEYCSLLCGWSLTQRKATFGGFCAGYHFWLANARTGTRQNFQGFAVITCGLLTGLWRNQPGKKLKKKGFSAENRKFCRDSAITGGGVGWRSIPFSSSSFSPSFPIRCSFLINALSPPLVSFNRAFLETLEP